MKKYIAAIVIGLLAVPAISQAQFKAGDVELTLAGTGSSDHNMDNSAIGIQGSLGYFVTKEVEVSIRQIVSLESEDAGDFWAFETRVAADYHFDLDRLQPFLGASLGYQYGRNSSENLDNVIGGIEGGVKYFLNSTTFIYGMVSYDMPVCNGAFDEGFWVYSIGLGVKL